MTSSPFHPDELDAQARAGKGAAGAGIRGFMPDQHREFFALLPYLFVATADTAGWPLATMLTGAPGFMHSPDPTTLRIDALPDPRDPTADGFGEGAEIGVLGLDLATRRRNRANGTIAARDAVEPAQHATGSIETLAALDAPARSLIAQADTLFVASRSRPGIGAGGGL